MTNVKALMFHCRAKDSVKHFHVTRRDNGYSFGFNHFGTLQDFVNHFANQPLLGSDAGEAQIRSTSCPSISTSISTAISFSLSLSLPNVNMNINIIFIIDNINSMIVIMININMIFIIMIISVTISNSDCVVV